MSKRWNSYLFAVAATVGVACLRHLLDLSLGAEFNFLLPFTLAVMVAAWHGGLWCGLFATLLNTAVGISFVMDAADGWRITASDAVRVAMFAAIGVIISLLCESLHRYRRQAEDAAAVAALRQQEVEREVADRHAAQQRLRLVLEGVPQLVWTCLPDGRCDYLSRQWVEYTGASEAALLGDGWIEAVHPDDRPDMLDRWRQAVGTGRPFDVEFRIRDGAGAYRWFKTRAVRIDQPDGSEKWFGTNTDIHDRKLIEAELKELNATLEHRVSDRTRELRESKDFLRAVVEASPSGLILVNTKGQITLANRQTERMFGWRQEELIGHAVEVLLPVHVRAQHPADREAYFAAPEARAMGTGRDLRGWRQDGGEFPVEVGLTPLELQGERFVLASVIDITERKQAERGERQNESTMRQLADFIPQLCWMAHPDGHIFWYNRRWYDYTGTTPEQMQSWGWQFVHHPDTLPAVLARWRESIRTGEPFEMVFPLLRKDGVFRPFLTRVEPVKDSAGQVARWFGTNTDVAAAKEAEERVKANERHLRSVLNSLAAFVGVLTPDGTLAEVNEAALQAAGLSAADVLGRPFEATYWWSHSPQSQDQLRAAIDRARAGQSSRYDVKVRGSAGRLLDIDFMLHPMFDEAGRVTHLIPSAIDITDRKQAQEALRSRTAQLAFALASTGVGMWLNTYPLGRLDWDERTRELFFVPPAVEPTVELFWSRLHPDDRELTLRAVERAIEGRTLYAIDHRAIDPVTGTVRWIRSMGQATYGADGAPVRFDGVNFDITTQKRAEETLRVTNDELEVQVQCRTAELTDANRRLQESLHEKEVLLKEIHHRVKNNLQIVSTLLDLQSDQTQDRLALEMFKESRGRVKSMALIHERLYRSQDLARVNFAEYVRQLAEDLYRTYKVSDDDIVLHVEVAVPPLPIDIAIPCGLLMNELMSNCLKHGFKEVSAGWIRVTLCGDGSNNVLTVSDNGAGFPPGFDFRNPASFGLQLVNTLVEQLHGEIELSSQEGSEFVVTFATNDSNRTRAVT